MANYLHSTPTPLDVDPRLAPHGGRPRVWLRRPPRSAPLTSSDSQLCEHGERERKLLLTHRSSALPPLSPSPLSHSPLRNSIISTLVTHIHPVVVGKLGGELSHVCVCVCVCVCACVMLSGYICRGGFVYETDSPLSPSCIL